MLVIAKISHGEYVCTIGHSELEKFLGLYYNKKEKLEVGAEINLGAAYDYESKICEAVRKMEDLVDASEAVTSALKQAKIVKKRILKEK